MGMSARQRSFLNQRITVSFWSGADGYGKPTYTAPHTFAARVTFEGDYLRRAGDATASAKAEIWMDVADTSGVAITDIIASIQAGKVPPPHEFQILNSSKITLPDGSTQAVIRFGALYDKTSINHYTAFTT